MEKKIIGVDISNQHDSTSVFIHFRNNGNYDESAVNEPMLYKSKVVGVITEVNKDYVHGNIYENPELLEK